MISNSFEIKELVDLLRNYTYKQFRHQLGGFLKVGRCVWYITGNIGHLEAIKLVERTRALFKLKNVNIEDVVKVKTVAINPKESYLVECPRNDESNHNSCAISYYEVGRQGSDLAKNLTTRIIMHYLKQPFFDDLRTMQQLGHTVHSRVVVTRDVLGCQFLVESSKHSCEYLYDAINNFLITMR